jgi:adenylosuccinate lyase
MRSWEQARDFKELLKADKEISAHLTGGELDALFDLGEYLSNIDYIFKRVFE